MKYKIEIEGEAMAWNEGDLAVRTLHAVTIPDDMTLLDQAFACVSLVGHVISKSPDPDRLLELICQKAKTVRQAEAP